MIDEGYLRFLQKSSLFTIIPEVLDELAPFMEIEFSTPKKVLYQRGTVLDALVIPLEEPLSLIGERGTTFLQKGRTLGLTALLRDTPIPYDVVSDDFNKLLILPRKHLMGYLDSHLEILTYLLLMTECEPFRRIKHTLSEKNVPREKLITLASDLSEPVPFRQDLFDRGIILIESGNFSITGDGFSGTLKGGEFVCGYKAVNRPNPGYSLEGEGKVRLIEFEALRKIGLEREALEYLASDPWVKQIKVSSKRPLTKTAIPPDVLRPWTDTDPALDPTDQKLCDSDWDGISEGLLFILRHFKLEINRAIIDNRLLRSPQTLCLSSIAEILEGQHLLTRILQWKEDADLLQLPLLVPFGNRLIVILQRDPKTFSCFDPCYGFLKIDREYLLSECPDTAISMIPIKLNKEAANKDSKKRAGAEKKGPGQRSLTFGFIFNIIKTEKNSALRIGLLTLCTYGLGAIGPKANGILLDEVLRTEDHATLWMCLSGLALVGAFTVLFNYIKNKLITKSSMTLDDILTRFIYAQAQKLDPASFGNIGTGGILNRLSEMEKIRSFFSTETLSVLFGIGATIIYGGMLAGYGAILVVFILAYFLLILVIQYFGRKHLYKMNLAEFNLQSKTNSFIGDCISNVLAIKAFSASEAMARQWENYNVQLVSLGKQSAAFGSLLNQVIDFLGQAVKIGIIWYCVTSLNKPESPLSFGDIFAIIQLIGQTISPMGSLVNFLTSLEDMKLSLDKVNDIVFANSEAPDQAKHSINIDGKIKFDSVSFKYESEGALILKEVSLTIYPGQVVAIVGKSGSGKTTIANLIARENLPTIGRIFFDDVDSAYVDPSELKSQIGYIQQNNKLFSGTIQSNVAFKDECPDQELLETAYTLANCYPFLQSFPQGDQQFLAEGGMGLSGGQKQRVSMARTVYMNPKIMILDEATSALDSESETAIISKILENKGKVTSIVIAHRLSTIRNADIVFVVDEGRIVQEGTHNELIQKNGVYKDLFQDQAS